MPDPPLSSLGWAAVSFNPPCGGAVGRETAPVGRGGGAATSRHSPSVNPTGCHLPIASRQGGSSCPLPVECSRSRRGQFRRRSIARSEEHTSELQSLMRISYAVFCLKKKIHIKKQNTIRKQQTYTAK